MTTIEKKSLRVGKYVDQNHVDTLVRTYKQERWAQTSDRLGREDSLNGYYTVYEMQEFLQRANEAGADRIRIHFGVYPKDFTERPENAGLQTVVFVATKTQETEAGIVEKNVFIETEQGPRILAYNMMSTPGYPTGRTPGVADDDWGGIGVTLVDLGNKGLAIV